MIVRQSCCCDKLDTHLVLLTQLTDTDKNKSNRDWSEFGHGLRIQWTVAHKLLPNALPCPLLHRVSTMAGSACMSGQDGLAHGAGFKRSRASCCAYINKHPFFELHMLLLSNL